MSVQAVTQISPSTVAHGSTENPVINHSIWMYLGNHPAECNIFALVCKYPWTHPLEQIHSKLCRDYRQENVLGIDLWEMTELLSIFAFGKLDSQYYIFESTIIMQLLNFLFNFHLWNVAFAQSSKYKITVSITCKGAFFPVFSKCKTWKYDLLFCI